MINKTLTTIILNAAVENHKAIPYNIPAKSCHKSFPVFKKEIVHTSDKVAILNAGMTESTAGVLVKKVVAVANKKRLLKAIFSPSQYLAMIEILNSNKTPNNKKNHFKPNGEMKICFTDPISQMKSGFSSVKISLYGA